jgi:hypothetical protein
MQDSRTTQPTAASPETTTEDTEMRRISRRNWMIVPVVALTVAACDDSTAPTGYGTDELTTELAITPDHVHAFETLVTFTVSVTDPDGNPVTDFDVLQVERRLDGAASYSVMETELDGDFYVVERKFEASGDYDVRVQGLRASDAALVLLHEEETQLHAVRPHGEEGGYRLELEPDPGHIHEGDEATVQFWILDETTRDPITGMTPTIFIVEPVAGTSEYAAVEGAGGLYTAAHTFTDAGETDVGIRFTGTDALEHEWSLAIEVHEAH